MNKTLKAAFTLVELLVVIAIIGILSGLIIVGMSSTTQSANIARGQIFSASLRDSSLMNLVAELKFDETSGTTAYDTWGTNNGTLNNFTLDTTDGWRSGSQCVFGGCLQFDGVNDYVNLGNGTNLQMPNAVTIDIWVNFNDLSVTSYILSKRTAWNDASGYSFLFDKATVNGIEIRGRSGNYARAENAGLATNRWYNIVGEMNDSGSDNKIYINGVNMTTRTTATETLENNALNVILGANSPASANWFNGEIDGLRIYNVVIPTSQVRENYYAGISRLLSSGSFDMMEYINRIKEI